MKPGKFKSLMLTSIVVGSCLGLGAAVLAKASNAVVTQKKIKTEWSHFPVSPPIGMPPVTQKSIDLAVAIYGIRIPKTAAYPKLNFKLADRGLSTRRAWAEKIEVEIGPSAYTSWGLLASTLAHELEIHCNQNFLMISLMDSVGLDGTGWAERQAYLHELNNGNRFGLSTYSRELIADTMDYYYSIDASESFGTKVSLRFGKTLGRWLARNPVQKNK